MQNYVNKDFWIPRVLIAMSSGIALYALWIILLATGHIMDTLMLIIGCVIWVRYLC